MATPAPPGGPEGQKAQGINLGFSLYPNSRSLSLSSGLSKLQKPVQSEIALCESSAHTGIILYHCFVHAPWSLRALGPAGGPFSTRYL